MEEFKKRHPGDGAKTKGRGLSIRRLNLAMIGLTLLLSALLRTALGALRKAFRAACARPGTEAGGGSPA